MMSRRRVIGSAVLATCSAAARSEIHVHCITFPAVLDQWLTAEDIADAVHWIATRPAHVRINVMTMMPSCQSFSGMTIKRKSG